MMNRSNAQLFEGLSPTFADLVFHPHRVHPAGIAATVEFSNKYGASVVRFPGSYGNDSGLYELAVLAPDGSLDYSTPITDDVEGYLSEESVTRILREIAALPAKEPAL